MDNEQFKAGQKEGENTTIPMDGNSMKQNDPYFALGYIAGYMKTLTLAAKSVHFIASEAGKLMCRYSLVNNISENHAFAVIDEGIKVPFSEVKEDFRAGMKEEQES